ncbi:MAG: dipeptide ABC transporter ATP-binding protein [Gammaproteobacteria bacterium]|nr:dipeptide ABC transporter ATP-binding protein [Gammaproteobacteria bacterium]
MSVNQALLQIDNLCVGLKTCDEIRPVVKHVTFSIEAGKTLALVGESGSGKTLTSLSIMQLLPLNGVISQTSTIAFEGKDLLTCTELEMRKIRGGKIGMIFQEAMTALNPVLTIGHQVNEVLRIHKPTMSRKQRHNKIVALLAEVGIAEPASCAKKYPFELSGGMKQRAMIAVALAGEPKLLIADEPTTALDVTIQKQVLDKLKEIQTQRKMGILFITHNLGVVYQMADYVIVMKEGEIVEQAETKQFFQNPQHPYSQQLLTAVADWRNILPCHPPTQKPIAQIENLKIHFPIRKGLFKRVVGSVKAVDGVSLNLYPGRTLALVGESGSGKTTTGLGILQLLSITDGSVIYKGEQLVNAQHAQLQKLRAKFQMIFQDPYSSMNPRMIVKDIIAEGMITQKIGKNEQERDKFVQDLLIKVGLDPEYRYRFPHEFSGGQRQRICIARALAVQPECIICDEPTSSLDVSIQQHVLNLLQSLQSEMQLSYLMITHDFAVVSKMAHDVAVMRAGKIVESGSVEDILIHPQHPYTKELLSAVPHFNHQREQDNESL